MYAAAAWGGEVQRWLFDASGPGGICRLGLLFRLYFQGSNTENGFRRGEAEGCNVCGTQGLVAE